MGKTKYFISGIALNGIETTFEVSDTTYMKIVLINKAKNIDIEYWEHSKILSSWDISDK